MYRSFTTPLDSYLRIFLPNDLQLIEFTRKAYSVSSLLVTYKETSPGTHLRSTQPYMKFTTPPYR
jgi:hypothetical protein